MNKMHRKVELARILEFDFGNKIKSKIFFQKSNFTQKYCENIFSHSVFNVIEKKINTNH